MPEQLPKDPNKDMRKIGTEPDQFDSVEHAEQWNWNLDKYLKDRYPGGMDWLAYSRMRKMP